MNVNDTTNDALLNEVTLLRAHNEVLEKKLKESEFAAANLSSQSTSIDRDVAERIGAKEMVHDSEKSYRGLFNAISDAIYIQDNDGKFLDVNNGAVEMYGYPREFFIGKFPDVLSAPGRNDVEQLQQCIEKAFHGEPQRFEFWGMRSNGEIFPKEVQLNRGKYDNKDVVIALARDISERKQAEQKLEMLAHSLRSASESVAITDLNEMLFMLMKHFEKCTALQTKS